MKTRILLPLFLASGIASAQGVRFGLQAGLSAPQGDAEDLVDNKIGFTLGANVAIEFKGGHALRPRLDITQHKDSLGGIDIRNTTIFFGADYNYFVGGKAGDGFYVLAGLGAANTKLDLTVRGYGSADEDKTSLAFGLGAGWQFTPKVGTELRYASTRPDFGGSSAFKNDAINLTLTFRF